MLEKAWLLGMEHLGYAGYFDSTYYLHRHSAYFSAARRDIRQYAGFALSSRSNAFLMPPLLSAGQKRSSSSSPRTRWFFFRTHRGYLFDHEHVGGQHQSGQVSFFICSNWHESFQLFDGFAGPRCREKPAELVFPWLVAFTTNIMPGLVWNKLWLFRIAGEIQNDIQSLFNTYLSACILNYFSPISSTIQVPTSAENSILHLRWLPHAWFGGGAWQISGPDLKPLADGLGVFVGCFIPMTSAGTKKSKILLKSHAAFFSPKSGQSVQPLYRCIAGCSVCCCRKLLWLLSMVSIKNWNHWRYGTLWTSVGHDETDQFSVDVPPPNEAVLLMALNLILPLPPVPLDSLVCCNSNSSAWRA